MFDVALVLDSTLLTRSKRTIHYYFSVIDDLVVTAKKLNEQQLNSLIWLASSMNKANTDEGSIH